MRPLILTMSLLFTAHNSLSAQSVGELSETVKRLQLQVSALEAKIVELSALSPQLQKAQSAIAQLDSKTTAMASTLAEISTKTTAFATGLNELQVRLKGFSVSSGNYILTAGTGSMTIRASSLILESTGPVNVTAGTTANMTVGSTMALSVGSNLSLTSGAALTMKGLTSSALESPGTLSLKSGGSGVLETANDLSLRTRTLNLYGLNSVLLESPRGMFNVSGTLDIRGTKVDIRNAVINGN